MSTLSYKIGKNTNYSYTYYDLIDITMMNFSLHNIRGTNVYAIDVTECYPDCNDEGDRDPFGGTNGDPIPQCDETQGFVLDTESNECVCALGVGEDGTCIKSPIADMGIICDAEGMKFVTCSWNVRQTLGIQQSGIASNPTLFAQDIVFAATSGVGLVLVIALLVMGFKYVMGGMDENSTGDLKKNMTRLIIGLLLVVGSYTIIRLIQYVARGY